MSFTLHGKTCTLVLFELPGGEIKSLHWMEGLLEMRGSTVFLLDKEGGGATRIPPHLVDDIELVTDEHRECMEEIVSEYCLRAFYNGKLKGRTLDIDTVLAKSSGPSAAE